MKDGVLTLGGSGDTRTCASLIGVETIVGFVGLVTSSLISVLVGPMRSMIVSIPGEDGALFELVDSIFLA